MARVKSGKITTTHEVGDPTQVGLVRLQEVDQAPRGGNHDLHAAVEVVHLDALGDTSVHARVLDLRRLAELVALLLDLHRQLSRGRHHENDRPISLLEVRL